MQEIDIPPGLDINLLSFKGYNLITENNQVKPRVGMYIKNEIKYTRKIVKYKEVWLIKKKVKKFEWKCAFFQQAMIWAWHGQSTLQTTCINVPETGLGKIMDCS